MNAYPRVWDAADSAFALQYSPSEAAARMAVTLVADLVKKNLPAERRATVLKELQVWASEPDSKKQPAKMPTDAWLSTIIVLEARSHLLVEGGKLTPLTQEWMMSEVLGALAQGTPVAPRFESSAPR